MNKVFLIVITAIFGLIVAIKIGLFNAIFMFLLVGIIPGTQIIIPANIMLLMISTIICALLFYPTARDILRIIIIRYSVQPMHSSKTHLPKRRFSEI